MVVHRDDLSKDIIVIFRTFDELVSTCASMLPALRSRLHLKVALLLRWSRWLALFRDLSWNCSSQCDSRCTHDTSLRHAHINLRCEDNQASGTSPGNMLLLYFSRCVNLRVGAMTVLHDDIEHLMLLHDSSMHPVSSFAGFGTASYSDRENRTDGRS